MKILVTGATGFIGHHIVNSLLTKRYKIRCLVRKNSNYKPLKKTGVEIWFGDLTNKKSINGIVDGIDIIFHLGAVGNINATSKKYYKEYRKVNVDGTKNLLEQCTRHKIKKFIHFSSMAVMGNLKKEGSVTENDKCKPTTPYGKSKLESETIALKFWKKYQIPVVILRPTMVYGEGEKEEMKKIIKFVKLRIVPIFGDGKNLIHMTYVKDVVQAAITSSKRGNPGEVYIIDSECYTWNELVDLIAKKNKIKIFKFHIQISVSKIIISIVEKISNFFGIIPPFTSERLINLTNKRIYDISKARKELGYRPKIKFKVPYV
jgi:nucleoside-diphosphate-sugar epimerase